MIIFIGLIAGLINGMFGSGAGMIVLPGLISTMHMDNKVARGTSLFILVSVSIVTCLFYFRDITDFNNLWYITAGGILGGVIGAKLVKIVPKELLKKILGIIMIISGIRMIMR